MLSPIEKGVNMVGKWKYLSLLVLLFVILTMVIGACSNLATELDVTERNGSGDSSFPFDQNIDDSSLETIPMGGDLTISMFSAPNGAITPLFQHSNKHLPLLNAVYESLIILDDEMQWQPLLAQDWVFENEGQTVIYTLRSDVMWHDGQQLTAQDVKFTYDTLAHPDYSGDYAYYVQDLIGFEDYQNGVIDQFPGVTVISDYELAFHFKEHVENVLYKTSFSIVPEHILGDFNVEQLDQIEETTDYKRMIGTGPFKAGEYIAQQFYTLESNDLYWRGRPYIDQLTWVVIHPDIALDLLRTNNIDILTLPNDTRLTEDDFVQSISGVEVIELPSFSYIYMGYHFADHNEPFTQTLLYAVNRSKIVSDILEGQGRVIGHEYDSQEAIKILEDANYHDTNGDGFRQWPDQQELIIQIHYPHEAKLFEGVATNIKEDFADIGLRVELGYTSDKQEFSQPNVEDENVVHLFLDKWDLFEGSSKGIFQEEDHELYEQWEQVRTGGFAHISLFEPFDRLAYNTKIKNMQAINLNAWQNMHKWYIGEENDES